MKKTLILLLLSLNLFAQNKVEKYFGISGIKSIQSVKLNGVSRTDLKAIYTANFVKKTAVKKDWTLFETEESEGNYKIEVYYNRRTQPIVFRGHFSFQDDEAEIDSSVVVKPVDPITPATITPTLFKRGYVNASVVINPAQGHYLYDDGKGLKFIADKVSINDLTLESNPNVRWILEGVRMPSNVSLNGFVLPEHYRGRMVQIVTEYVQSDGTISNHFSYDILIKGQSNYSQIFLDEVSKKKQEYNFDAYPNIDGLKNKKFLTYSRNLKDIPKNINGVDYLQTKGFTLSPTNFPNLSYPNSKLGAFSDLEAAQTTPSTNPNEYLFEVCRDGMQVLFNGEQRQGYYPGELQTTEQLIKYKSDVNNVVAKNKSKGKYSIYSWQVFNNVGFTDWVQGNYGNIQIGLQNPKSDILNYGFNSLLADTYQNYEVNQYSMDYNDWLAYNIQTLIAGKEKFGVEAYLLLWGQVEPMNGAGLVYNSFGLENGGYANNYWHKQSASVEYLRNSAIWSLVIDGFTVWDEYHSKLYDSKLTNMNTISVDMQTGKGVGYSQREYPRSWMGNLNILGDVFQEINDYKAILEDEKSSFKPYNGQIWENRRDKKPTVFMKESKFGTVVIAQNFFQKYNEVSEVIVKGVQIKLKGNQAQIIKL